MGGFSVNPHVQSCVSEQAWCSCSAARKACAPPTCFVSVATCSAIHEIDCTHRWSFFLIFFNSIYFFYISLNTGQILPISLPTQLSLLKKKKSEKQNKPTPQETNKTKTRLIRTKCAPNNSIKWNKKSPQILMSLFCVGHYSCVWGLP